jgi:hypothetical protein
MDTKPASPAHERDTQSAPRTPHETKKITMPLTQTTSNRPSDAAANTRRKGAGELKADG